jgi:2-polyprenyl-3-methyl-5-hydroxy-6-metoxy-1,4-benzoquinol methylase
LAREGARVVAIDISADRLDALTKDHPDLAPIRVPAT